jgi:ADP-glucose pyrophosphorylase
LDEIHNSIKGLNPQKRVPVPETVNAGPLEYDYLLMLERERQETLLIKDGHRLVKVDISQVLSGIESETKRKESGDRVTNIYIGGDVKDSNIVAGDHDVVENS